MRTDLLTSTLQRYFSVEQVLPIGRAALGIYAGLRVWAEPEKTLTVAMPAFVCQDLLAAIHMAGCHPYLCDIDPATAMVPASEWIQARAAGASAAIVVHPFGNPANSAAIRNIFPAPECLLIDDAAQALGARATPGLAGTNGDIGVISFGATKQIEVGGAALLIHDVKMLQACKAVLDTVIPTSPDMLYRHQFAFRQRYLDARARLVHYSDSSRFSGLLNAYAPLLCIGWQDGWSDDITRQLIELAQRCAKATLWEQAIAGTGLKPVGMAIERGCTPWRYACRLPGCDWMRQFSLGESLRSHGIQVSHWYLPASWWLDTNHRPLPGCEQLAQESFQFWLDPATPPEAIREASLRGMRYPDEYVIRMFYKLGLTTRTGHVLELGCGSANNLMHFAAHHWQATGVDVSSECLADGRYNLDACGLPGTLIQHDLNTGLPSLSGPFHALLAPSTLYYLRRESVWTCLRQARPLLSPGAAVYLRMRLPDDHRAGRGTAAPGLNTWQLTCDYTGESGLLNVFWDEYELLDLLHQTLGLQPARLTRLRVAYDNLQCGRVARNSDIVLWGQLP